MSRPFFFFFHVTMLYDSFIIFIVIIVIPYATIFRIDWCGLSANIPISVYYWRRVAYNKPYGQSNGNKIYHGLTYILHVKDCKCKSSLWEGRMFLYGEQWCNIRSIPVLYRPLHVHTALVWVLQHCTICQIVRSDSLYFRSSPSRPRDSVRNPL
jgi:hypothetical protein